MNKASIGIAALSFAFAGAVFAQAPAATATPPVDSHAAHAGKMDFTSLDQNKDGRVSKAEAQSHMELTSSFATLDTDSDSHLSQMEFGKWKAPAPGVSAPESGKATTPAPKY